MAMTCLCACVNRSPYDLAGEFIDAGFGAFGRKALEFLDVIWGRFRPFPRAINTRSAESKIPIPSGGNGYSGDCASQISAKKRSM